MKDALIEASNFPLLEIFNGGPDVLNFSEVFYAYLTESILNISGKDRCQKLHHIEKNNLMISIILIYSNISIVDPIQLNTFFHYLFDQWLPYSYHKEDHSFDEIKGSKANAIQNFNRLYTLQKEQLQLILKEVKLTSKQKKNSESKYLQHLFIKLSKLHAETLSCKNYIPEFECEIIKLYSTSESSRLWYIYRKQLESVLSLLDIETINWGYLAFLSKNVVHDCSLVL
ncbi:hypothetical protein [Pedobacter sp. NJ-S-72]